VNTLNLPALGEESSAPFPPTSEALRYPNGLLAWGGDLEPERLLSAYRRGIFPWYTEGEPILWWSPAPRCVIYPADIHLSRRTRRRYHAKDFNITADSVFEQVIEGCAGARNGEPGSWITPAMQQAFIRLHLDGLAHSIEVWLDGYLVGGVYGLALGKVFFGESMFSHETDASKIALVALCRQLQSWDFVMLDCQVPNPHLRSLGAIKIPRRQFETQLKSAVNEPYQAGHWNRRFSVTKRW
jgi:leucyl/phenylalanyl-tRNA--protein transferase